MLVPVMQSFTLASKVDARVMPGSTASSLVCAALTMLCTLSLVSMMVFSMSALVASSATWRAQRLEREEVPGGGARNQRDDGEVQPTGLIISVVQH